MSDAPINAFAVYNEHEDVKDFTYTPITLGDNQVEIEIHACGVCHSDVHQRNNDWGSAQFPIVLGHEIVGVVVAMGSNVTCLTLGARVGVGPQTGSCDSCKQCDAGEAQLCNNKVKSYNSPTNDITQPYTYGGFADRIRVRADWAIPIPDALDTIDAAPLLCAGETTWTPLVQYARKGSRVGIAGVGGLGHIAIQFAHHLGCEVTAISHSPDKADQCLRLGANHFLNVQDDIAMRAACQTFDLILSTISADGIQWESYLALLQPQGTLAMVGLPKMISLRPALLVTKSLHLVGSYLANATEIRRMLMFSAEHCIKALTEILPLNAEGCNKALKRVENNLARYRIVLVKQ